MGRIGRLVSREEMVVSTEGEEEALRKHRGWWGQKRRRASGAGTCIHCRVRVER
jgi:hypothetical protein